MTPAQYLDWAEKGYMVVPNALSATELERVRAAADRAEALWRSDTSREGQRSAALEQVQAPIEYDDALLELLWHPSTFPFVRSALGDDVSMIDNDFFITPPHTPRTHASWHHDVGQSGIYHPQSTLMVKVFFLLSDVNENSGGTALIPGSHRFAMDHQFPEVEDPRQMSGSVQMLGKAGTAYLFNGRVYHCAVNNESNVARRVLIYNYGHSWMKIWPGYEPSQKLLDKARESGDPVQMQLLGLAHAYSAQLPAIIG